MKADRSKVSPATIEAGNGIMKQLIIEGEINISESTREWINEHVLASRHISVLSFEVKGRRIKLTFADSQQVRLLHELAIKVDEITERLESEPPIDDLEETTEPNENVSK